MASKHPTWAIVGEPAASRPFSDGVFAIAITLLVLTIGALWLAHHGIFRRLASADGVVMRLNILLLISSRSSHSPPSSSPRQST